jgi:nucleoside-diphosphate-sugar epimerase
MKQATVIGGHGFIGGALVRYLIDAGWQCWVPERSSVWPVKGIELGHIFFCAGLTADYLQRPVETVEAQVSLLARVLQSKSYESLVYLSSARLYDSLGPGVVAKESMPLLVSPAVDRHFFDLTKLTGESICHVMGQGRARVARLSCVYAAASDAPGFLSSLLGQVSELPMGGILKLKSSPYYARDYIHLQDTLSALVAIALGGSQLIYNVASGETMRNDQLAHLIVEVSGRCIEFSSDKEVPLPASIDISRLYQEFGLRPASVSAAIRPFLENLSR